MNDFSARFQENQNVIFAINSFLLHLTVIDIKKFAIKSKSFQNGYYWQSPYVNIGSDNEVLRYFKYCTVS